MNSPSGAYPWKRVLLTFAVGFMIVDIAVGTAGVSRNRRPLALVADALQWLIVYPGGSIGAGVGTVLLLFGRYVLPALQDSVIEAVVIVCSPLFAVRSLIYELLTAVGIKGEPAQVFAIGSVILVAFVALTAAVIFCCVKEGIAEEEEKERERDKAKKD
jgi:hypothetical protein